MRLEPWFAQPDRVLGTAIVLPGRWGGMATPLLHWPASLLTQSGWSVLGISWGEDVLSAPGEESVRRCARSALAQVRPDLPIMVVAKSLGTFALGWAVENELPGVWLTPLLGEVSVVEAVARARQPTLLVGGTADPHWRPPAAAGTGVEIVELPGADHGLQGRDWRASLLDQVTIFERIAAFAARLGH